MSQKSLSLWLKAVVSGLFLIGIAFTFVLIPLYGKELIAKYPEFSGAFWPWTIFVVLFSVPCFAALVCGWKIAENVGLDRSFTKESAAVLKTVAVLAAFDSAFFFVGNWFLALFNYSFPPLLLVITPLVTFVGTAVAVVFFALSHLIYKAALLREDADLTI